jgi:hypothetical protein
LLLRRHGSIVFVSEDRGEFMELQQIPGVGPSIAQDLRDLGVRHVADLNGADPEALYEQLCTLRGEHIDRCVLYVFRCAVYFASHEAHDPERLKWWSWKDRKDSVA